MTINKEKTNNVNITEITKAGKAHTHRKKIKTQVTALITITIVVALLVSGILLSYRNLPKAIRSRCYRKAVPQLMPFPII